MPLLTDLTGKTAIVTGAVGIGYGIAFRLAEAGAKVMFASVHEAEARESALKLSRLGFEAKGIKVDVSLEDDVQDMVTQAVQAFGEIDILVNNAGIYPYKTLSEMQLEDFEKVMHINLRGVFLCTKYVTEQMIKQGHGGKIINITSIDALHPSNIGLAHYDASKHGVWGFTKNVALELSAHNIWVNAIAPGAILTEGVKKLNADMGQFAKKIPMKRLGDPDDIGKVALFLASDMANYLTGSQIVVDGGLLLG
jgi:2-dehydro-3-deoxy-D-gluconate 5-dehydrogenase